MRLDRGSWVAVSDAFLCFCCGFGLGGDFVGFVLGGFVGGVQFWGWMGSRLLGRLDVAGVGFVI